MRRVIFVSIFLFSLVNPCFSQTDGFTQISQSKYFNIYSQKELNPLRLIRQLDIHSEYLLLDSVSSGQEKLQDMLGAIFDAIFLEASDVLRMYLYRFKGNIKICQNQKELNNAFRKFFDRDLRDPSFYIRNTNSIYINMRNIHPGALAYDIARAILSHYFVVLPPAEVQEALAKDVGYQITKLAK